LKLQVVRDDKYNYRALLDKSDESVTLSNVVFGRYWCTFEHRYHYVDGNPDITEVDEDEEKLVCSGCGQAISYNYRSSTQRLMLKSWISHTITCKDLQSKYESEYEKNTYKRADKIDIQPGKYNGTVTTWRPSAALPRALPSRPSKDKITSSSTIYRNNTTQVRHQASNSASPARSPRDSRPQVSGSPMTEIPSSPASSASPERIVFAAPSRKRLRIESEDVSTWMSEQPAPKRRVIAIKREQHEGNISWIFRPLSVISRGITNFLGVVSDLE